MKLGRKPVRRDPRVKSLALYTRALSLAPPPPAVDYYSKVQGSWPMDLNDQLGDCTIAAVSHCATLWTANAQVQPFLMSDADVLEAYEKIGGYDPSNPGTDQGCVEQDVLQAWCRDGIDGDVLDGYVMLNCTDLDEIRDAIHWFGSVYIGISIPKSAMENTDLWEVVVGSEIAGGHAVMLAGYDSDHFYTVSWGKLIPTTPEFLLTYMDEAYGLLSKDFIDQTGKTPAGLSLDDMIANCATLKFGAVRK